MARPVEAMLALSIICAVLGCNTQSEDDRTSRDRPKQTYKEELLTANGADYTIVKDEHLRRVKRVVNVLLPAPITETDLRKTAFAIHNQYPDYERTFILYWLPSMEVEGMAWATTHFNPSLKVVIQGMSVDEEESVKQTALKADAVGRWLDHTPYIGGAIVIESEGDRLFLVRRFADGSGELRWEVRETQFDGRRGFDPVVPRPDKTFYVIAADGSLEIWDEQGLFSKALPIQ